MARKYDRAVVQLQDGRELYLKNVSWGTSLEGTVVDTNYEVVIKASNVGVLIPNVSLQEFNRYIDGDLELLEAGRWDDTE